MRQAWLLALMMCCGVMASSAEREWENPVFESREAAISAARSDSLRLGQESPAALRLFMKLMSLEREAGQSVAGISVIHPAAFVDNEIQQRTVERFLGEIPRQREVLEARLKRFGYPETPGLVYCRLVDSVDAFSGLGRASSDRMSQVGGVTYYCRYVVLPLSYVGEKNLRELRRSAALNPSLDVEGTIRRWQRESFASLVSTFRHEMVHVRTNATLGVPAYSDRLAYPTWFHEGTATYLSADPHSGLSQSYKEFQNLFFYLVQRFGVGDLQDFYRMVLSGEKVVIALAEVYRIDEVSELFVRSSRWHRTKDAAKTGFWIAGFLMVFGAVRGRDRPYVGGLQILCGVGLALAISSGLAEHLVGLRGPGVVLAVKTAFAFGATAFGVCGFRRVVRHYSRRTGNTV